MSWKLVSSQRYLRTQARVVVEYFFIAISEWTLQMLHVKTFWNLSSFHLLSRTPLNCKNHECVAAFWPLTCKKSALKWTIKKSSTLLADQKSWPHFKSRHISDYLLGMCTVLSFSVISFSMYNMHVMAVHWKKHSHSPHQKLHQWYLHCGSFTSLLVILQTWCICRTLQTFIGIWLHHILLLFVVT